MRLIKADKVAKQATSESYFDCKPSSDFSLGFTLGSTWAEDQLSPLFVEFAHWCMSGYYTASECDLWVPIDSHPSRDPLNWKTTGELFDLWIEEQHKKADHLPK